MKEIGVYIHIPFCSSKCPYCDFYSLTENEKVMDKYVEKVKEEIKKYKGISADTVYFGGGTPSVMGGERLSEILSVIKENFSLKNPEITTEINPSSCDENLIKIISEAGFNRVSFGVQSAVENERKYLGRKSEISAIKEKINFAKEYGIKNISLDLMLGIPEQDMKSLKKSVDFCLEENVTHISAYMLKIEEGTRFFDIKDTLPLPDEDELCDYYEFLCDYLEKNNFHQYEISNFSLRGKESKHNLKYWNCEEYIGIGPSAHSFFEGKRFFHSRNLDEYFENPLSVIDDGTGGNPEEFLMLKLRLSDGVKEEEFFKKYGMYFPKKIREKSKKYEDNNLLISDGEGIRLTRKGFLLSNTIIGDLIDF